MRRCTFRELQIQVKILRPSLWKTRATFLILLWFPIYMNKFKGLNRGSEGDYTHYFLFSQKLILMSIIAVLQKNNHVDSNVNSHFIYTWLFPLLLYWVYCWYWGWKLWIASVMMSRGFIVSRRDEEMLCMVTLRPTLSPPTTPEPPHCVMYTDTGNAYRSATAAKNISMQMKKFWYPALTVPDLRKVN